MTRDWLLTLLAMSPYFLAATIVVLALIQKPARIGQDRPASDWCALHDRSRGTANPDARPSSFPHRFAEGPCEAVHRCTSLVRGRWLLLDPHAESSPRIGHFPTYPAGRARSGIPTRQLGAGLRFRSTGSDFVEQPSVLKKASGCGRVSAGPGTVTSLWSWSRPQP